MIHARAKIVAAVVAALTGLPTTAGRVKAGRAAPMPVAQTPYLLVYGRREASAPLTMGRAGRKLQRQLTLSVEAITVSALDNDGEIDAIAAEVEAALAADPTLGGLVQDLFLSATDLDATVEGETRTGRARLDYTVNYITVAAAPDQLV